MAKGIEKVIVGIFSVFYLVIFLVTVAGSNIEFYRKRHFFMENWQMIVLLIVVGIVAGIFYQKKRKKIENWLVFLDRKILVFSVGLLLLQLCISVHIYFMTGWDSGIITANADYVANGKTGELWNWYYSRCPNNSLLTAVYAGVFWISERIGVPSTAVRLLLVCLQCVISSWTGYLVYQCAKRIVGNGVGPAMVWWTYVLLIGLSPWMIIPYSDASCLFLPVLLFYWYLTLWEGKAAYLKCAGIGIAAYLGYEMKPMVFIVLLAILGIELLENGKEKVSLKRWGGLLVILCAMVCTVGVCKVVNLEKMMGFEIDPEAEFGLTHYLMMGLNDEHSGVFLLEDAEFSQSVSTKKERSQENLRVAKERVEQFGLKGLLLHLTKKTLVNFNDGTFAWGQEGNFYGIELNFPNTCIRRFLRNVYYDQGSYHKIYQCFVQILWMFVLLGVSANGIATMLQKEKLKKEYLVMITSLIGIAMFVLLFEARARYLYTFVPMFILAAIDGYKKVYQIGIRHMERKRAS